ncbi:cation:proton antiporter [Propionibacteriaceae bacterium Y1700]|uniref:cation:proton antiporter n=1 Tax=Microlunatus sp. Y1700 TaxID=3418487 RepID=UPI003B7EB6E7
MVLILGLMACAVLLVGVGDRLRLPWPVLMVLLGLGVTLIPGLPDDLPIAPELILPLFLPPLLFATAQRTSWAQCKLRWKSILAMAVLLVVVTIACVAATAYLLIPAIGVSAAIVLGALLSPPDPVAVEAVAGPLKMPRRILSTLHVEGLFNDATAIVVFQVALTATVQDVDFRVSTALLQFIIGLVAAVAIGLVLAGAARGLTRLVTSTAGANGLTVILPFVVYVVAEHVHASGVVAVVVAALQYRAIGDVDAAAARLGHRALWDVVELLVTGVAFGLIGLDAKQVVLGAGDDLPAMLGRSLILAGVVVLVRTVWMLAAQALLRRRTDPNLAPRRVREAVLMSWCGMRGLATLALALSLPLTTASGAPFPYRGEIVLTAVTVLTVTLVLGGLTLPSGLRVLGIKESAAVEEAAEQLVRDRAQRASLARMTELKTELDLPEELRQSMAERLGHLSERLAGEPVSESERAKVEQMQKHWKTWQLVQTESLAAARRAVEQARREPGIDPEAADRVLERLDRRAVMLD